MSEEFDFAAFREDPEAIYVVPRYHGSEDPFFRATKARVGAGKVQGRGRCDSCGHQVFNTQTALQMGGVRKWCAQCALREAGAGPDDYARLALDLSHCPESPCPYSASEPIC